MTIKDQLYSMLQQTKNATYGYIHSQLLCLLKSFAN